jgi:hypothetical protein
VFKGWAEDLPHVGTESPATSQVHPSTPVKILKRDASSMQESFDFPQDSPSQKRRKLIAAALVEGGSSGHSGLSITSPNATDNNAWNILVSALQPSPSGSQPFSRYHVSKSMS